MEKANQNLNVNIEKYLLIVEFERYRYDIYHKNRQKDR